MQRRTVTTLTRVLLPAIFLAVALLAVGCGGSGDEETGIIEDTQATETTEADAGTADGAALFADSCAGCHGEDATGIGNAPSLVGTALNADAIRTTIIEGRGAMPAYGDRYSGEEVDALVQYVQGL